MKFWFLTFILFAFSAQAQVDTGERTKTPQEERIKLETYLFACQLNDRLIIRNQYKVDCFSNYHHYGPSRSVTPSSSGSIRIAGYNLLHPGTSKALFKDYLLVAKIMNQYDVVSALELLATVGHDNAHNLSLVNFIQTAPSLKEQLKLLKTKEKDENKKKEIDVRISKLESDVQKAYSLFRMPGYLKILTALKQIDPSWSLILSPRGDSALQGSVEEMVGFFYRASKVRLAVNPHCDEFKSYNAGSAAGCIVNLSEKFMKKNFTQSFARRPFIASFVSGSMKFSLISSHVVFTYSGDEEDSKKLMKDVFGVESPGDLGITGINMSNFARFAEVKLTLDFMERFKKRYNDKNIMYFGDTNINANNAFWPEVLKSFTGATLHITEPTTLSPLRYTADGKETYGVANSYDHFIFDRSTFSNCSQGEVYNYFKSSIKNDIDRMYTIRELNKGFTPRFNLRREGIEETSIIPGGDVPPEDDTLPTKFDYPLTAAGKIKMDRIVDNFSNYLKGLYTVERNEIVWDDFQYQERLEGAKRRVFLNQLTNAFYYRNFQELLSDHFPVSVTCKN